MNRDSNFIALVGLSFEFPQAKDSDFFWNGLMDGLCFYHSPEQIFDSSFVPAWGSVADSSGFDYRFFGYSYKEACYMDPQHRLLLQHSWHAMEQAGYMNQTCLPVTGVFASASINNYLHHNLNNLLDANKEDELVLGNTLDFLATRIAYKLNLTGPAFTVQSGCSSSLTALHQARVALLTKQCDMALVGAVSLSAPHDKGYEYLPKGIRSQNGQIRAFDADATGTVFTNGVAVLVLKRYADAKANRDNIIGVIRSTAINNDGMQKSSFTAPSIQAQAQVIEKALRVAEVKPEQIGLLEAHGTGTALGDPIEFEALLKVFGRKSTQPWCALQTVKANVGHMDTVSGFAGLIKAALALKQKQLPPQIHYEQTNEKIALKGSPFYINSQPVSLEKEFAGITALGIGGTNAHVILQRPEKTEVFHTAIGPGVVLLSAKSKTALEAMKNDYISWCEKNPNANMAEVAYTCMTGRTAMDYRMSLFAESAEQFKTTLMRTDPSQIQKIQPHQLAFMFPGQGAQYPNMGLELYQESPLFKQILDNHLHALESISGRSFKEMLFASQESSSLYETENTQPLLFAFEVALAKYLIQQGVIPSVLFGHSLGEYSALTISGVLSFTHAAKVVLTRAKLMAKTEQGLMLGVMCDEKTLFSLLTPEVNIAAYNTADLFTVSGSITAIQSFEQRCADAQVMTQTLKTRHGFHSYLIDPILGEFKALLETVTFSPPKIPIISNLDGQYLNYERLKEPEYWVQHMRRPVAFKDCVETALKQNQPSFLEVGPGNTLKNFVKHIISEHKNTVIANCLPHPKEKTSAVVNLQLALSQLWQKGYPVKWSNFAYQMQKKIALPLYPFELSSCWVKSNFQQDKKELVQTYRSFYREVTDFNPTDLSAEHFVILCEQESTFKTVVQMLAPHTVTYLSLREIIGSGDYLNESQLTLFVSSLTAIDKKIHLINALGLEALHHLDWKQKQNRLGLLLLKLVNTLSLLDTAKKIKKISVLTQNGLSLQSTVDPDIGLMAAMVKTINQERPQFSAKLIDLNYAERPSILNALKAKPVVLAIRNNSLFCERYEQVTSKESHLETPQKGCAVILGGTGHVGMEYTKAFLANNKQKIILVQRSSLDKLEHPQTQHEVKKAQAISALQTQYPGRIEVMQADIGDYESIKTCVENITHHFQEISTLIHSAGVDASMHYKLMHDVDVTFFEQCFYAKRQGLLNIAQLKQEFPIKQCHIVSSISSVLAGIGMYVYAGLHAYIDSFVQAQQKITPGEWSSINWEAWEFGTEEDELELFQQGSFGSHLNSLAINPEQGRQLIGRLMPQIEGRLIISSSDLQHRYDLWVEGKIEQTNQSLIERDTRPDLQTNYVKPRNKSEEQIMMVWSDTLAINDIGIDDNFFELGGHSLSALQMAQQLTQQFNKSISVIDLFTYPTIRKLATCLTQEKESASPNDTLNKRLIARKNAISRMKSKSKEH